MTIAILRLFAWLNLLGGVGLGVFLGTRGRDDLQAAIWFFAGLAAGVLGWAILLTLAQAAEQIGELYYERRRQGDPANEPR